jgi:hypothetical protein
MTKPTPKSLLNRIAFALLYLYVFTLPFAQAPEFGRAATASKMVGLAAMLAGLVTLVMRKQIRLLGAIHVTMAGFILWSAVTLCWSVAPDLTVQRIGIYLQLFVLVLLIWELCREEKDILGMLDAFVLGTIVPALSTIRGFIPGDHTLYERAKSVGFDPNALPFVLALSLPVSYFLILRKQGLITGWYRFQMGFAICAILLSGTPATLIAMFVGLSIVFWTFHTIPVRTRTNAFVMVLLMFAATAIFIPSSVWRHFEEETTKGGIGLTQALSSGVGSVQTTPLGGLGAGSMAAAHSPTVVKTGFTMFAETGFVGVACFMVLIGLLSLAAHRMPDITKSFWFTVLGVWAVGLCVLNWEYCPPAWVLIGLLAAHAASLNPESGEIKELRKRRDLEHQPLAAVGVEG